jgi:acyl-CoA synthetase (AMP-forming)/AMP-acid ligase II
MDVRTQMRSAARCNARREAVAAGDRRLTFAEAWERGVRLANGLLALGLEPQDRVGVLEDNTLESADLFLGAAIANLVRVPLYPRNARESHVHMLAHTGCGAVVVAKKYAAEIAAVRDELPELEHVLVRDLGYEDWLARQFAVDPDPAIDPEDYFIIRHIGGTTGKSKGVAYTHRPRLVLPLSAGRAGRFAPASGADQPRLGLSLHADLAGRRAQRHGREVRSGRPARVGAFTSPDMRRERTAYMFMVPTMLNAINRIPGIESIKFPDLKCMMVSAAPISDETALKAYEIFGDAMYQGYGQTEVLPVATMGPRQWFAKDVPGSQPLRACGMPLPFAEFQIWNENNQPVPPGEAGEIVAKTDGQMQGFWNNPQATAERMVDGWVKTGDIGRLDANGYLYRLDRADDMMISGGFNIYPAELENVIAAHPAVVEVAVFGIPDPKWGETPCAVVCVKREAAVTEKELVELCSVHLGNYQRPGKVVLRHDPRPKTPVGKIKRKELREPFWVGRERRVAGN